MINENSKSKNKKISYMVILYANDTIYTILFIIFLHLLNNDIIVKIKYIILSTL